MDKFLSTREVAKVLGISTALTRRLINRKGLPALMIGNGFKVKQSDLEEWLLNQEHQPKQAVRA